MSEIDIKKIFSQHIAFYFTMHTSTHTPTHTPFSLSNTHTQMITKALAVVISINCQKKQFFLQHWFCIIIVWRVHVCVHTEKKYIKFPTFAHKIIDETKYHTYNFYSDLNKLVSCTTISISILLLKKKKNAVVQTLTFQPSSIYMYKHYFCVPFSLFKKKKNIKVYIIKFC